jgi:heme O synthase-like polyprenyltransferase
MEAWILYAILLLWQFPHFMAIAWMYREDYDRAGYLMLPNGGARFPIVILQTTLPLLALIPISIVQFPMRHAAIFQWAGILPGTQVLLSMLSTETEHRNATCDRERNWNHKIVPDACELDNQDDSRKRHFHG